AQESLRRSNKRHNQVREYRQRLRYLHDNGVQVMSLFLLGLPGDDRDYLRNLPDLIQDIGVDVPVFSFAAPIEGTPFHQSLRDAGELLPGDILGGMDGMHLVYKPQNVAPDELELALFECMRRSYSFTSVTRRILRGMRSGFWGGLANGSANLAYAPYQRALARSGLERVKERGAWPGRERPRPIASCSQ
ncbi:MAG: hypothetical protein ACHP85_03750, partial [Burkholderiales bacterium]